MAVDDDLPPFASPAELSAYTQGKISASDPRVAGALEGASKAIRRYCGWHVYPELTQTVTLDGPGGRELALPTMHVTAISSATEEGTTLDASTLEWSELGEIRKSYWTRKYRGVTITFTHGYDDAEDVKQVVLQAVSRALSSPSGATREQAGQLSVSWALVAPGVSGGLALLQHEFATLDSYRIVSA